MKYFFFPVFIFLSFQGLAQSPKASSFIIQYSSVPKNNKSIDNKSTYLILENAESSVVYDIVVSNTKYTFYYLEVDKGHVSQMCCSDTSISKNLQPMFTDKYLEEAIHFKRKGYLNLRRKSDSSICLVKIYSFANESNYCRCTSDYARMFDFKKTNKFAHVIKPINFVRMPKKQKKIFSNKILDILKKFQNEYGLN